MNELTVERLRLTPEKREQLRGLTEAIEHGTARFITYEADLAARAFREIERLQAENRRLRFVAERVVRANKDVERHGYASLRRMVHALENVLWEVQG